MACGAVLGLDLYKMKKTFGGRAECETKRSFFSSFCVCCCCCCCLLLLLLLFVCFVSLFSFFFFILFMHMTRRALSGADLKWHYILGLDAYTQRDLFGAGCM